MSPKRFVAMLFMTAVLLGMFGFVAALVGGGIHAVRFLEGSSDSSFEGGQAVSSGKVELKQTYEGLGVSGPLNLVWIKSTGKPSYEIKGSDEILKHMKMKFEDDTLKFGVEGRNLHGEATITVWGPEPESVAMAGSGNATLDGLAGKNLTVSVAGSGDVNLSGKLDSLDISIAGSGDVDAMGLVCRKSSANIAGSGSVSIDVTEALDATIMGSGDITYKGSPKVNSTIAGSGSVRRED